MNDAVVVLDASALLAVLRKEPGSERVEPFLRTAVIDAVNLSEVVAKLAHDGVPVPVIRDAIDALELKVHPFDEGLAYEAGALRPVTRAYGLSFGDRACLALARRLAAKVLTADRAWSQLQLGLAVELVR